MAFGFKNFLKGFRLVPNSTSLITQTGDIEVLSGTGKLQYYNALVSPVISPIVTEAQPATLTGKTISGASNTISNIAYSSLTLTGSIVNADIAPGAAIAYGKLDLVGQILNADISNSAAIARTKLASGSINHVIINDGSGVFSSEATLAKSRGGTAQDNSSLTFPATGTLATLAGTETFSNKSFSDPVTLAEIATPSTPSSGNGKIYFKSDGFLYQLNDDGTETKVGAGSGGINYITNSDAESNTTGWAAYADAAGSTPVNGTGGSPVVTVTRSTSSPLRGTGSFLLTKDAANRQGEGVSYDFTIADADKAKPLAISFNYTPASGTFVAGDSSDLRVYLYDVTNAQVIQPAPYTIQGGSGSNHRFLGTFQTASNSNSYRLIIHVATTSASAYTFKFDDVSVGPQMLNYGSPVTDWVSYTSTVSGLGTGSATASAKYRRVGDSIEISALITKDGSAGTGGSTVTVSIPTGLSIDPTKISGLSTRSNTGSAIYTTSAFTNTIHSVFADSSANNLYFANSTSGNSFVGADFAANRTIHLTSTIPISGWSSTVEMSNDTDTRVCAARYSTDTTQTLAHGTIINFDDKDYDTHGAVTTGVGVWKFTAPIPGYYTVSYMTEALAIAATAGQFTTGRLYKNNNPFQYVGLDYVDAAATIPRVNTGSASIYLNAGDYIHLIMEETLSTDPTLNGNNQTNWIDIKRTSGPSAIAASETVAAKYTHTGSQLITTSAAQVDYTNKVYDTHGAVTTGASWKFTAPVSGKYEVSIFSIFGGTSASDKRAQVFISGVADSLVGFEPSGVSTNPVLTGSSTFNLLAGDTIDVRFSTSSGSQSLSANASENHISIYRIGN